MPGHTSAHEKASNRRSTTTSRSYNPGAGGVVEHTSTKKSTPSKSYSVKGTLSDPNEKDDTAAKISSFKGAGATKIQNQYMGVFSPLKVPLKAGSRKTRTYFYEDVLTSKRAKKNIGYTQYEFNKLSSTKQEEVYKDYLDKRMSGQTDAAGNISPGYSKVRTVHTDKYGNKSFKESIVRTDGGDDPKMRENVVTEKKVGGTTILTTEGKVAEDKAKSEEYDERKTKRRGRRRTILTSQTGATGNLQLGKRSLLGV
jgi:hypothetical protein